MMLGLAAHPAMPSRPPVRWPCPHTWHVSLARPLPCQRDRAARPPSPHLPYGLTYADLWRAPLVCSAQGLAPSPPIGTALSCHDLTHDSPHAETLVPRQANRLHRNGSCATRRGYGHEREAHAPHVRKSALPWGTGGEEAELSESRK